MKLHRRNILKAILLSGPVVLAACGARSSAPATAPTAAPISPTATVDPLRAKVESFARITLPDSARDLQAEFMANGNKTTVVKFSIPASDLALTLRQAGYPNGVTGLVNGHSTLQSHKELAWWQLQQAKSFAGDIHGESGFMRRITVDKSNPDRYVVYLEHLEL